MKQAQQQKPANHFADFDAFLRDQRTALPKQLMLANTQQQRELVLNTFFETIEQIKAQIQTAYGHASSAVDGSSPSKRLINKKSPVKSPMKKGKTKCNDENASPEHPETKSSPAKKMASPVKH
jgi:hypothetical protein